MLYKAFDWGLHSGHSDKPAYIVGNKEPYLQAHKLAYTLARMNLSQRVKAARKHAGLTQRELAKAARVEQPLISQLETGKTLKSAHIAQIAKACRVSALWLASGEGEMILSHTAAHEHGDDAAGNPPSSDDYALIPQYTAKGSSGNGYLNDHVEIKGGLAFKRDWLCRMGLKPDNLRVAYNHGDSNWPTLTDGEVVLLDVAALEPANGKMFALLDPDGEMIFKRLIRDIKGGWLIRSDNDNKTLYPDMPISDEGIRGVDIVGRIVWRGGAM